MEHLSIYSYSSQETIDFAKRIAKFLKKGDVLGFFGDLGSGKTTFIKGLAEGLGLKTKINSPSFVVLKIYSLKNKLPKHSLLFYHFDLYRLKSLKELEDIGYQDFIYNYGICVIEWADKAKTLLPEQYLKIKIQLEKDDARAINLEGHGERYDNFISDIKAKIKPKNKIN